MNGKSAWKGRTGRMPRRVNLDLVTANPRQVWSRDITSKNGPPLISAHNTHPHESPLPGWLHGIRLRNRVRERGCNDGARGNRNRNARALTDFSSLPLSPFPSLSHIFQWSIQVVGLLEKRDAVTLKEDNIDAEEWNNRWKNSERYSKPIY